MLGDGAAEAGSTGNVRYVGAGINGWGSGDIGAQINAAYVTLPPRGGTIVVVAAPNGACYSFTTPIVAALAGKYLLLEGGALASQVTRAATPACLNFLPTNASAAITLDYVPANEPTAIATHGIQNLTLINNQCETMGGCNSGATGISFGRANSGATGGAFAGLKVIGFGTGLALSSSNSRGGSLAVRDCSISYNTTGFLAIDADGGQVSFDACHFHGNATAVSSTSSLRISNSWMESNTVLGVNCSSPAACDINSDHFENAEADSTHFLAGNGVFSVLGGDMRDHRATGSADWWMHFAGASFFIMGTVLTSAGRTATNIVLNETTGVAEMQDNSPTILKNLYLDTSRIINPGSISSAAINKLEGVTAPAVGERTETSTAYNIDSRGSDNSPRPYSKYATAATASAISQASSPQSTEAALPMTTLKQFLASNNSFTGSNTHTGTETFAISNNICTVDGVKNIGLAGINTCHRRFTGASAPGMTYIPSNSPRTFLWSRPSNGAIIWDARFVNDPGFLEGAIPNQHSHIYYDFHAGANDSYESNNFSGPIGLSINAFADAGGVVGQNGKANVVAAQFGVVRSAESNRPVWSMDLNTNYNSYRNNAFGLEIDLNSNTANDDNLKGYGLDIICGGGKFRCGIGLNMIGIGTGTWNYGAVIGNYHQFGIQLGPGDSKNAVALQVLPFDDSTAPEIIGRNAANRTTVWSIRNNGEAIFPSVNASTLQGILITPNRDNPFGGIVNLASGDVIRWRNRINTGNLDLSKNASDTLLFNGHALLNTGVLASGVQLKRGVSGCGTDASVGATCTVTVTWPSAFIDTNYTLTGCTGSGIVSGAPTIQGVTAKSASSVTVQTVALTAVRAKFASIECGAVHD